MKIEEMIEKIVDDGSSEKMQKLHEMFKDLVCDLKVSNPKMYHEYKTCLYELAFGEKISEEMAQNWVKEMKPAGLHYTMEETTNAMKKYDYNCDKIDYFIACNMMYNDYFDILKDNEEILFRMAYDFLDDEDANKNKLYRYWKYIVKKD